MAKYRDNSGRFVEVGDIEDQQKDDVGLYDIENPYAGKDLNLNELFYENDSVIESIRNYYADRKGEIKVNNRKDLVEEFVTDMRWAETNEVSAGTLMYYIGNSNNTAKNNFRNAYDAFKAMPNFYAEGYEGETKGERVGRLQKVLKIIHYLLY